jgi:hypothetical protein
LTGGVGRHKPQSTHWEPIWFGNEETRAVAHDGLLHLKGCANPFYRCRGW